MWLLDEASGTTDLWMANIGGETLMADSAGWASLDLPRESMSRHLIACEEGRTEIVEYDGDDQRLPEAVREFNRTAAVKSLLVAPLHLSPKTLGWIALSSAEDSECERRWRRALIDATAKQATLALYYSRLVDRSLLEARRQQSERNGITRDIHDAGAGFGAILAAQAAQLPAANLPPARFRDRRSSRAHASRRGAAVSRRCDAVRDAKTVAALGAWSACAPDSDVPVELVIVISVVRAGCPARIVGIAQEARPTPPATRARAASSFTPAAEGVAFRLSVADDGRDDG